MVEPIRRRVREASARGLVDCTKWRNNKRGTDFASSGNYVPNTTVAYSSHPPSAVLRPPFPSTLQGPISIMRPSNDEHPGPPCVSALRRVRVTYSSEQIKGSRLTRKLSAPCQPFAEPSP